MAGQKLSTRCVPVRTFAAREKEREIQRIVFLRRKLLYSCTLRSWPVGFRRLQSSRQGYCFTDTPRRGARLFAPGWVHGARVQKVHVTRWRNLGWGILEWDVRGI